MALAAPARTTRVVWHQTRLPAIATVVSGIALILLLANFVLVLGVRSQLAAIATVQDDLIELRAELEQLAGEQRQTTEALRRIANGSLGDVAERIENQAEQLRALADGLEGTRAGVRAVQADVRALRATTTEISERLAGIERALERERGAPATTAGLPRSPCLAAETSARAPRLPARPSGSAPRR